MRRSIIFLPLLLNAAVCIVFLVARPPATELIEKREQAERAHGVSDSSSDPYMLIAERPLRQWNAWHGGESLWVKTLEVVNWPAVVAAKRVGDKWAGDHAFSGAATYRRESWIRAYAFAITSALQWLLVGIAIAWLWSRNKPGASGATRQAIV
jgi:hypothetical protein